MVSTKKKKSTMTGNGPGHINLEKKPKNNSKKNNSEKKLKNSKIFSQQEKMKSGGKKSTVKHSISSTKTDVKTGQLNSQPDIIVDTRETRSKVPKVLEKFANVIYQPLAYGDYQVDNDVVFERKTFSDWEGSVIDGRIFRQAEGLRENFKTPIFILEGGPNYGARGYARPKLNKASLHGSYLSISTGFGIPIIPSANPTETANIILQAAKRKEKPDRPISVQTHKKGTTISEMRQQIFSCFPGIGPKLARELDAMPYPLIQILGAIDRCQIKKLGPKKIKSIQEVLNKC